MNDLVPLEEVFKKKVDMVVPSKEMICALHNTLCFLVDGIDEVIGIFHRLEKEVFISKHS